MHIEITEAPEGRSLHGTDEVWVQVKTSPEDQILDWPTVRSHIQEMRPDLSPPTLPKSYHPGDFRDGETGQIYLEDWWVFEKVSTASDNRSVL
ncbi:MAG TPA: hypothetical protein VFH56_14360 [Acidimicrobiales bacterium]|nr:hypothetical protein [Acidimicrobiales bacterium]